MQDTIWANDGETKVATIADLPWVTSPSGRRHSDDATEQANACLIASAPELWAIARQYRLELENAGMTDGPVYRTVCAVLDKAEGKV